MLISGSLRQASTNTAALRTLRLALPDDLHGVMYEGVSALPAFNPDHDTAPYHPEVQRLRAEIHASAALIFSTPEYGGALPGSLKNLLDWTIGDGQAGSIYEKPVAWITTSPRRGDGAHAELRTVLGYAHASIIDGACVHVPVSGDLLADDGLVADPQARVLIARVGVVVAEELRTRGSAAPPLP